VTDYSIGRLVKREQEQSYERWVEFCFFLREWIFSCAMPRYLFYEEKTVMD